MTIKNRTVIIQKDKTLSKITIPKLSIMWFFQWLKLALDYQGKIIEFILSENDIIKEQLMHKTEDPEVLFYKLLGKDISALLDDLRNEYKSLIEDGKLTEQDLDLYFRKSINLFQVGEGL